MKTAELIALGQEILSVSDNPDLVVEKVAQYVSEFESWNLAHKSLLAGGASAQQIQEFKALAGVHAKVLDLAEKLKAQTRDSLKGLRKKGKGIMAYTDILPKSISMSGSRKG